MEMVSLKTGGSYFSFLLSDLTPATLELLQKALPTPPPQKVTQRNKEEKVKEVTNVKRRASRGREERKRERSRRRMSQEPGPAFLSCAIVSSMLLSSLLVSHLPFPFCRRNPKRLRMASLRRWS